MQQDKTELEMSTADYDKRY